MMSGKYKNMYQPPYNPKEIRKLFPDKAEKLLKDPVHKWRAETGIELIHQEPTKKERLRIWQNWQQMSEEQKKISDQKSLELYGLTNHPHHQKLI